DADGDVPRLFTHADVYATAARCARTVIERAQAFADGNSGIHLPDADPTVWGERLHRYQRMQHTAQTRAATANLGAVFHPATFDAAYPAIQVGGVMVFVYVQADGVVQVSLDLDEVQPWLIRGGQHLVPIQVSINGNDVY